MNILLVGEYSRLHNTLKEGLQQKGAHVTLIGDGDGFKNFPVDLSIRPLFSEKFLIKKLKVLLFKLFNWDLSEFERGIRFYLKLPKLRNYDVVQLINEKPIKTLPSLERFLLKKLFQNNKKVFVLSCGVDYHTVDYLLKKKFRYSILSPYFEDPSLEPHFKYILRYHSKNNLKTHQWVMEHCHGIIASDLDYYFPNQHHPKFIGLIPNPINISLNTPTQKTSEGKILIFLGINRGNYHAKGIRYFEEALERIAEKYPEKVAVKITTNVPFETYSKIYNSADILLDQVFSYDQGYNALEAMAKGKVVFTGAEKEFLDTYQLQEDEVCVNALPNVDYLVEKLSDFVENPEKLETVGRNARQFIEREHHYITIAEKYLHSYQNY